MSLKRQKLEYRKARLKEIMEIRKKFCDGECESCEDKFFCDLILSEIKKYECGGND